MSSKLQIAANRRNAAHSTGPCSVQGKATSSRNSLKTGIYAESAIIRGEEEKDLKLLIAEYFSRFQPATPEDRALLDTLVHCESLLRRFRRIEAEIFEYKFSRLDYWANDDEPDPHTNAGEVFDAMDATFSRLQRRITETERSFLRTLHELERRQAESQSHPAAPPPARPKPVTSVAPPLAPEAKPIGFVPQNTPALAADPPLPAAKSRPLAM